ncbi:GNAT family N-acetyltransferase [Filobacillus milosensis]|uniref:GNAT family N-acetyltransferase n=1 Tax=Filobacillus milosensis TaxID=94137 RepID=A0A4Y8IEK5_9BACI|nr:GNAT family N-acetyltransferase [Filobacillus milosensis]TFB14676.1 GNAT family N-acetyltransferase [Filobacillus milosensis]
MRYVQTREIIPEVDQSFLFELYASTRQNEMMLWGWDNQQQIEFLLIQYRAQQQSYEQQYPNLYKLLISVKSENAGRVLIDHSQSCLTLVDISLLPKFRGSGIGTKLIKELQHEAAKNKISIRLTVRPDNPALKLYKRLGFHVIDGNDINIYMEWKSLK